MKFKARLPLVIGFMFCLAVGGIGQAQTQSERSLSAQDHFKAGLAAFQKRDFKQARLSFIDSLKLEPESLPALHNLAMTEQRLGENGKALALWRKALVTHPGDKATEQAITWTRDKLERPEIPHEVEYWETFRNLALTNISLNQYLVLTAVLLLLGGWFLLRYFGARRRALLDEKPGPPFPTVAVICTGLFVLFCLFSAAKAWDMSELRGTILPKKVEAKSTPDASGTPLFDLYEGLEVIIRLRNRDWTQVTYPGGPTGWIPSSSVFATTDRVAP